MPESRILPIKPSAQHVLRHGKAYPHDQIVQLQKRKYETFIFEKFSKEMPGEKQSQILVIPHFLSHAQCQEILNWSKHEGQWENLAWKGVEEGENFIERCDAPQFKSKVEEFALQHVLPNYPYEFSGYYQPKIHRMSAGNSLREHWDNGYVIEGKDGPQIMELGRYGVSIVIYLNSDWQGGELVFPYYGMCVAPTTGTAICFPSSHEFSHLVRKVESGERYCMLSFVALQNPKENQ